jgi:23S rRNA pseudouridine2605 synthase
LSNVPEAERQRIQKILAAAGKGSRREIERWIQEGRIRLGDRVAVLGDRVGPGDVLRLDDKTIEIKADCHAIQRVLVYNKPVGEVVTRSDPQGRRTVFESLPEISGHKWIAVGRLDLNTAGLLLVTDSGELANALMHPRYGLIREYSVRVQGNLGDKGRRALLAGVVLEDGVAKFQSIVDDVRSGASGANRWYRVTLAEGRNREVRRLFSAAGVRVSRLVRVRYGPIQLPHDLTSGRWRELAQDEVLRLKGLVSMPAA